MSCTPVSQFTDEDYARGAEGAVFAHLVKLELPARVEMTVKI
jgi:hypothetical protein